MSAKQSTAPDRKLVHADIKPENPPERSARYLDVPNMPWEPTKFPGIKIKVLYTDDSGITTALFSNPVPWSRCTNTPHSNRPT